MGRVKGVALVAALAALVAHACVDVTEKGPAPAPAAAGGASGGEKGGATGGAAGDAGGPMATEAYVPPCAICMRAENCCRAMGNTDCDYAAACITARASEQQQFYVALCRGMIEAASADGKKPSDVCGS